MHVTRCKHPTRRKLIKQTAREITVWMIDSGINVELTDIVERYLCGQGSVTMKSCMRRTQMQFLQLAEDTGSLGWASFAEGRLARNCWRSVVKPMMSKAGSRYALVV